MPLRPNDSTKITIMDLMWMGLTNNKLIPENVELFKLVLKFQEGRKWNKQ